MPQTSQASASRAEDITRPLAPAEVAAVEAAEARAWADCYSAAPAAFQAGAGIETAWVGGALLIAWAATGRRYFSRTIGLAVTEPATRATVDAVVDWYDQRGISMFLLQSLPHCRPAEYEAWLREHGLEPFDRQDRIVRDAQAFDPPPAGDRDIRVEPVTASNTEAWSDFLQRIYGLETAGWLPRLIGRRGWHPYVAREDGEIVAARTMCIGADGHAWLGMDGPVPGLGTQDYEPDAAICAAIVEDGLRLGVRRFLADIEAPSDAMDTPAYANFAALGFTRPYVRTHWARIS
ncbi:MAG TPA: hypothetical protein VH247_14255 [Thermoleophilaceae bacterium]|nr:hypothetical protein [Thermoleophilaceae bacterium]